MHLCLEPLLSSLCPTLAEEGGSTCRGGAGGWRVSVVVCGKEVNGMKQTVICLWLMMTKYFPPAKVELSRNY